MRRSGEEEQDMFYAERVKFGKQDGYMVKQVRNGTCIVEQFVPEECYKEFCAAIGAVPEEV